MDGFTIAIWVITVTWFIISMVKDKKKTLRSIKMSSSMMKNMVGEIIGILFLIGLLLTFIPPESIKRYLGESNTLVATLAAALVGSITLVPAFVAFPLVGSLIKVGASIIPAVAFLTTLTMVGIVTFPLEKKEFGIKFTIVRNCLSFVFAIAIALVMGVVM